MSQAEINKLLTEEIDSNQKTIANSSEQNSEEELSTRELPSSQVAFSKCGQDDDSLPEGYYETTKFRIIDELNSQSEDELRSESDSRSLDAVTMGQSHSSAEMCVSEEEDESASSSPKNHPTGLLNSSFKTTNLQSNSADDMLNLLSGQFIIPSENQIEKDFEVIDNVHRSEKIGPSFIYDTASQKIVAPEGMHIYVADM